MQSKRMRKILEENGYVLWEYTPTMFKPLFGNIDPPSFTRRMRFLLEYLSKGSYKVYYLEVNGDLVGYNVFAPGGRRLKCSTKNDLVDGPSFVLPQHRGHGYVTILKKMILNNCCDGYDYVYGWIKKDNIASIKACVKAGFDVDYGELKVVGKMRKLQQTAKGEGTNVIIRYKLH